MRLLLEVVQRLRSLLSAAREDRELAEEIRFHIDKGIEKNLAAGMSPREARRQAHIKFGGVERMRERTREARGVGWVENALRDVRYAARRLRGSPGFTLSVTAVLTLAIGATTAVFSLFDAVVLAPLPYPEPDRIVRVWAVNPQGFDRNTISGANAAEWPERAESFSAMAAYRSGIFATLTGAGNPSIRIAATVQSEIFDVTGVRPMLGRRFVEADDVGGGLGVIVSHGIWEELLGGDSTAVGRTLELGGNAWEIVGVMPEDFAFPDASVDLWMPLVTGSPGVEPDDRGTHSLVAVGRLRDDVSLDVAQAEMSAVAAQEARDHPETAGWGINLVALQDDMTADARPLLILLMVAVGAVLVVACGNLANLLLTRAVGRDRELAVRTALGARRTRIVGQLLTESLLLTCIGGACGLLAAPVLIRSFTTLVPYGIPLIERAGLDARVLLFSATLTLLCALAIGLFPALRRATPMVGAALRGSRDLGQAHGRLRASLLVAQVSLAVVLMVGAGLFVRTFSSLASTDLGFDHRDLVTMSIALPTGRYPTVDRQSRFYADLVERTRAIPGVVDAAATSGPPGASGMMTFPFVIFGRESASVSGREDAEDYRIVTTDYFETLGQPPTRGRTFDEDDDATSQSVVVVNEAFVRKYWPDQDPIGQRIALPLFEAAGRWQEVVGVVADARLRGPDVAPGPRIYTPYEQHDQAWQSFLTVVARVRPGTDFQPIHDRMRAALLELDGRIAPSGLSTIEGFYGAATAPRTFAMTLAIAFALAALLLSVVGLYGLVSYGVAARRKEIGLRMALGADGMGVVRAVLQRSLALAAIGAGIGVAIAVVASQAIETMLYGVTPTDLPTYVGTLSLVTLVVLAAAAVPAWRAARIDPAGALAAE